MIYGLLPMPTIQGKIQYRETVYEGFENTFDAFASLFKGGTNIGKIVVKI